MEFAEGVQITKTLPSSFDGVFGPELEQPWSADEAERQWTAALALAAKSDVVVMTMGELAMMDLEYSSRSSLDLPGRQQELLEKVAALGKPVVLLLFSTRPLSLAWASEHVPAIMDCYFGGTETGNAVADLLFGDAVPGGKLPVTWPRSVGQVPIYYAHTLSHKPYGTDGVASRYWDLPTTPQYPFGYGLSYTTFVISDLHVSASGGGGRIVDGDGDGGEHGQAGGRRGGANVPAPEVWVGVAAGTGAEGVRAGDAGPG